MTPEQLTFELPIRPALQREDFLVSPSNEEAVGFIDLWPQWPGPVACVMGPPGSGKTHLAHVWQAKSDAQICAATDVNEGLVTSIVSKTALIIRRADLGVDEEALFHLFNVITRVEGFLLLTAERAPSAWPISLPDLKSRLVTASVIELQPPDDVLIASLLVKQFSDRQIRVDPELIAYLIPRIERSSTAVERVVDVLDRAAMRDKSKITVAFARKIHAEDH